MKITNRLNLPMPLVNAVQNDPYNAGDSDYTPTSLLRPPRIAQLMQQRKGELTEDVADRIWALFGQVTHSIIERAASHELVEKRLFFEVAGKKISAQIDIWKGKIIWDWKTTSIYAGKAGPKDEWVQQGNIERLACHENGIDVEGIQFVGLYRDWSCMRAYRTKEDYPQSQIEVFNLPMWPLDKTRTFIEERIQLHEAAKEQLPLCTEEERWQDPERFALMKKGQKRAVKLYDTEAQAEAAKVWVNDKTKNYVEHRPSQPKRCLHFCPVSGYCSQFRDLMQEEQ